jgi:hypothetical protein
MVSDAFREESALEIFAMSRRGFAGQLRERRGECGRNHLVREGRSITSADGGAHSAWPSRKRIVYDWRPVTHDDEKSGEASPGLDLRDSCKQLILRGMYFRKKSWNLLQRKAHEADLHPVPRVRKE